MTVKLSYNSNQILFLKGKHYVYSSFINTSKERRQMKDYFCENCFRDRNIRKYIRKHGKQIQKKFECHFCSFESEIYEQNVDECIDEHIQECITLKKQSLTQKKFEDKELELYDQCAKECKVKYQKICEEKFSEPIYVIKQEEFIQKLREVISKLYTYDWNNTYDNMCRDASQNYCEENDETPEQYANLPSLNDLEGIEDKQEYYFSTLEEIFQDFKIDFYDKFEDIFNKYILTEKENHIAHTEGGELEDWDSNKKIWKYNCLYSTEEYKIGNWEDFRKYTKHEARYFEHKDSQFSVIKTLEEFRPFFKRMCIKNDEVIYRVRPINSSKEKEDIEQKPNREIGKIPKDKLAYTQNNRFSPIGISYGYFSFDKQTALCESRVEVDNNVAIGKFKLNHTLIDLRNKSLTKYINPFSDDFEINLYCEALFLQAFIKDISKPISSKDTLLEYVPTQVIAEYIWSIGYQGFIFDSSQKKGGENIVIFGENPSFNEYEIGKIVTKNIDYTWVNYGSN